MTQIPLTEPAETRLEEPPGSLEALAAGEDANDVARRHPSCLAAWAALGEEADVDARDVEAYAYFRVGYHRGLDRLRRAGWRGSGQVRWAHVPNRGFLRSLAGLSRAAATLGERDEAERCAAFLGQLCPDPPPELVP
jgi:hypothetical protein